MNHLQVVMEQFVDELAIEVVETLGDDWVEALGPLSDKAAETLFGDRLIPTSDENEDFQMAFALSDEVVEESSDDWNIMDTISPIITADIGPDFRLERAVNVIASYAKKTGIITVSLMVRGLGYHDDE